MLQLPGNIPGLESPPTGGIGLPDVPTIPSFGFPPLGFTPPSLGGLTPPVPFIHTTTPALQQPLSPLIPGPPFPSSDSPSQSAIPARN